MSSTSFVIVQSVLLVHDVLLSSFEVYHQLRLQFGDVHNIGELDSRFSFPAFRHPAELVLLKYIALLHNCHRVSVCQGTSTVLGNSTDSTFRFLVRFLVKDWTAVTSHKPLTRFDGLCIHSPRRSNASLPISFFTRRNSVRRNSYCFQQ